MDPLFVEYSLWERRLSSFDEVKDRDMLSECGHSCLELAMAGFFYAGYADCVRCFYCGLGLKGWARDKNVFKEHQRHRSDCKFLETITEPMRTAAARTVLGDTLNEDVTTDPLAETTDNGEFTVLRSENQLMKKRLFCRMCFRNRSNELSLPCGELVVCKSCNDIISTCPACNAKVVATCSIYLV